MKNCKKVLDIFKGGLREFVEVAVKQHHEKLLGMLPDSTNSGFTRLQSCHQCTRLNLKPRHAENECPSQNLCICKVRRRDKRHCLNEICDYIYEGIIEDHVKFSPNLKTTYISQWTQNYWELAMCFMQHRSESAKSTNLLDLLHLVSYNRFILKKFLTDASVDSKQKEREIGSIVDKVIKICRKVKQSAGNCSSLDIVNLCMLLSKINDRNAYTAIGELEKIAESISGNGNKDCQTDSDFEANVRDAVSQHFKSAENALRCRSKGTELPPLQLSFEQKLLVCRTTETFIERKFTESNIMDVIFGDQRGKTILVKTKIDAYRSISQWNKKDWFIYNVLECYYSLKSKSGREKEFRENITLDCQYTDILIVSKSISNRIDMPMRRFCEGVKNDILPKRKQCLVILDFSDENVKRLLQNDRDVFEAHTLVILLRDWVSCSQLYEKTQSVAYVKMQHVGELVIQNVCTNLKVRKFPKEGARVIQQCLYKCVRKIGDKNLSTLTLEGISFVDNSTKIKVSNIPQLKTLKLRDCALTPVFGPSLLSIEVHSVEKRLSFYLEQLRLVFYPALQSCICLQNIATSDIRIGHKTVCLKFNTSTIERDAKEYFGVQLRDFDKDIALDLLDIEVARELNAANCNFEDFLMAGKEEKLHILNSIKYSLLEFDPNFVHIYSAEFYQKSKQAHVIVFVCFMKENFDVDKEGSWGEYRGFNTFLRSYSQVSSESLIAESCGPNYDEIDECTEEKLKYTAEIISFNCRKLMAKHSNLDIIGVSMGKARENELDTTDGLHIVFYVRLKSFIPYGEEPFPTTLSNPDKPSVGVRIDVREGYYIPLADSHGAIIHPLTKVSQIAMGCSIGFYNNNSAATLGPLVEIESGTDEARTKDLGFLTVCHLFSLRSDYQSVIRDRGKVVQPSSRDERCVDLAANRRGTGLYGDTVCGEVVACEYSDEIDAALVRITKRHPRKALFITCGKGDLSEAGFSGVPEYNDGSTVSFSDCFRKNIVKIGKKTELTLGQCRFQGMAIRLIEDKLTATCPISGNKNRVHMKNLLQVAGFGETIFSDVGDSGAGLFLVKDDNRLSCVGMVIGKTADGFTVATPIQTILERLSGSPQLSTSLENITITMKAFNNQ